MLATFQLIHNRCQRIFTVLPHGPVRNFANWKKNFSCLDDSYSGLAALQLITISPSASSSSCYTYCIMRFRTQQGFPTSTRQRMKHRKRRKFKAQKSSASTLVSNAKRKSSTEHEAPKSMKHRKQRMFRAGNRFTTPTCMKHRKQRKLNLRQPSVLPCKAEEAQSATTKCATSQSRGASIRKQRMEHHKQRKDHSAYVFVLLYARSKGCIQVRGEMS